MARAAMGLIAIALIGLSAGYWLGGFAVGGGTHRVYYGYHMPDAGRSVEAERGVQRVGAEPALELID